MVGTGVLIPHLLLHTAGVSASPSIIALGVLVRPHPPRQLAAVITGKGMEETI